MDFVFDLLQGAGIAAAIGIRPFLPTLLVGALAAGDLGIDFDGTDFSFLEQPAFLAAVVVLLAITIIAVRRSGPDTLDRQPWAYLLGSFAVVVGLLMAAGVDGRPRQQRRAGHHRRDAVRRARPRGRARPARPDAQAPRPRGRERAAALRRGRRPAWPPG